MSGVFTNFFKTKQGKGAQQPKKAGSSAAKTSDEKPAVNQQAEVNEEKPIQKRAIAKKIEKKADAEAYRVVAHPLISEKATDLAQVNKYIFIVPMSANKSEVKKKIKNIYGVVPVEVNMIVRRGKIARHGRHAGRTKDFKKAIVTIAKEDKIEVYEGV